MAVLAFANITGDAADEWIGQGIAESLTVDFAKIGGLTVIPREHVFELQRNLQISGRGADDRHSLELGRRLGASFVVSGAYQRLRDRVRITGQVIEVTVGAVGGDREARRHHRSDLRAAGSAGAGPRQDRHGSRARPSGEREAIADETDVSLEAFEAYSRGMLNLRMASRDAVDRAIGLFEQALELSPGYVEAMIALGSALDLKGAFLAMPDLLERSLALLQQAVALKPESAEAHIRLGETLADLGQIDEGIAEMHEGLRLAPDNAEAHANLARNYWMGKGDTELAITHFRRALALNPDAGYTHLQLALLHALRGELDEAEREARAAVVLQEQAMSGTQGLLLRGRAVPSGIRLLPARPVRRGHPRVSPGAGVRLDERPRPPGADDDRDLPEALRRLPAEGRSRRTRSSTSTGRCGPSTSGWPGAATIRSRATTWPPCTRCAATSSRRAGISRSHWPKSACSRGGAWSAIRTSTR